MPLSEAGAIDVVMKKIVLRVDKSKIAQRNNVPDKVF